MNTHPFDLVIGLDRSDRKADLYHIDTRSGKTEKHIIPVHAHSRALGSVARTYPSSTTIHFSGLYHAAFRPHFTSASHTASQRSHFGSTTDPVAIL